MVKATTKKLILVGPQQSGKTAIANFIHDPSRGAIGRKESSYDPTAGCRILKCEVAGAPVELWDVSGDSQYESCWPAVMQGAGTPASASSSSASNVKVHNDKVDGVILVYNPDVPSHADEVMLFYEHFVRNRGIKDTDCMVLVHTKDPPVSFRSRTPKRLERCHVHNTTFSTTKEVERHFTTFVQQLR